MVSSENFLEWLRGAHSQLKIDAFMPSSRPGCCDGNAHCCRRAMSASVTWLEAEAIWGSIKNWPEADRRALAVRAKKMVDELEKKIASDKDVIDYRELKAREAALRSVSDPTCPLLVIKDGQSPLCGVYDSRPLICAGFGGSCKVIPTGRDENNRPTTEVVFLGCDTAYEAASAVQENYEWINYGAIESNLFNLVAPPVKTGPSLVSRPGVIMKPIPFWIVDLTDDGGDLTNPLSIFDNIRRQLEGLLNAANKNLNEAGAQTD